ncbi:MAG: hypothetical protein ABW047_14675 [Nitrospiraceae bacterium]
MIVEVEANSNCESGFLGRFKELGPARPVVHVRLYDRQATGDWCAVTGWSDAAEPSCPAVARPVEDSGAGITYLVSGGIFGLRFRPLDLTEAWSAESPHQWGEPYLAVADARDLRFEEPSRGTV